MVKEHLVFRGTQTKILLHDDLVGKRKGEEVCHDQTSELQKFIIPKKCDLVTDGYRLV